MRGNDSDWNKQYVRAQEALRRLDHCVYCGNPRDDFDHVPPKLFLERPLPNDLMAVPSCHTCNGGFSLDEQYMLTIMSVCGTSELLKAKRENGGKVDRSLFRCGGSLGWRIINSVNKDENARSGILDPEYDRLDRIVRKIGIGLFTMSQLVVVKGVSRFEHARLFQKEDIPSLLVDSIEDAIDRGRNWWADIQPNVFSYLIAPDAPGTSMCVMKFYEEFWGIVSCPDPRDFPTLIETA